MFTTTAAVVELQPRAGDTSQARVTAPTPATVSAVQWSATPLRVASTAATVEVDVMPFLARVAEGGPFAAYHKALSELGADFVRYAPWCPYPRVVVPELTPPDCTKTKRATNWNSTLFDVIMKDFMEAVCGPDAAKGTCTRFGRADACRDECETRQARAVRRVHGERIHPVRARVVRQQRGTRALRAARRPARRRPGWRLPWLDGSTLEFAEDEPQNARLVGGCGGVCGWVRPAGAAWL